LQESSSFRERRRSMSESAKRILKGDEIAVVARNLD